MLKFILTFFLFEGRLNVKLLTFKISPVHFVHGFLSGSGSCLAITEVDSTEANEEEGTVIAFPEVDRCDVTEGRKMVLSLIDSPVGWHVLDEDVVVNFTEVFLVFGRELNTNSRGSLLGHFKRFLCRCGITEAHKAITSRLVVISKGDLARDYLTILREVGLNIL